LKGRREGNSDEKREVKREVEWKGSGNRIGKGLI
jgi:hypothetical protein